ncbi:MAG: trehalose-phosphatase [Geobacteraceae bacterium GWC2_58_44]|nr:MAG: trehalose-phosphatase [Geobacteraceae bacterium GWC2_58_44]HBG04726.1 trehalose-phosphatase [Geobacter sp.]
MPLYLFHSQGLATLARYVAPDTLFSFDLDGTLAPIVEERAAARIAKPVRGALQRLAGLAKVAVITGRSRKDALSILGFEPHLVIGNHGAEWPADKENRNWQLVEHCLTWRDRLQGSLSEVQGVEIEFKGESISLHYRKAQDPDLALSLIHAAIDRLEPAPRRFGGKYVVNVIPVGAFGKGDALAAAMELFGSARAVYFGDDETDEEVFRLQRDEVFGVHVGRDDQSAATCYLNRQSEMLGLLNSIVGTLESQRDEGSDPEEG